MKHCFKKVAAIGLAIMLATGIMTGCSTSKDSKTQNGDKVLFTYDGEKVSLKEAWIYAKMTAKQYENSYQTYFGENFWTTQMGTDEKGNPMTFEDYAKNQVLSQIKQVIVLDKKAEELKLSLTDDEKKNCKDYAEAFAKDETGAAILKECGGSKDDMQKIYEDNMLASKAQQDMIKDVDTKVSEEEARGSKIARIVFTTTKTDKSGKTINMTKKEKAEVLKKAEAALKKIQKGTALDKVAEELKYTNTTETFANGKSEEGAAFEKKLAKMKDGQLINEVLECDNGYVIAQLTAYNDKETTENNKNSIIQQRQSDAFKKAYDALTKDLEAKWDAEKDVDQKLWAEIVLHKADSTATESSTQTGKAAEATTAAAEATTAAK